MNNISSVFKAFYASYDYELISTRYKQLTRQTHFPDLFKSISFSVDVRMKNDILAMQLKTDNIVSIELLTIIGFFFDRYSVVRKCVWTNNKDNIFRFFMVGIEVFKDFGGKIKLVFSDEEKKTLVDMMINQYDDEEVRITDRLYENFQLLENMNWHSYKEHVKALIMEEERASHIEEVTCMDLPLDWDNIFANDERATGIHTDSISDGLILSLNNLGKVDIEYISQITGEDYKTVIKTLKGSIFQNPDTWDECFYKGWETADEYLSGKVVHKLQAATKADEIYKGYFADNVAALKNILPQNISADDIYITLGSPWVPEDIIDDFIEHLLGVYEYAEYPTSHDEKSGTWYIPWKSRYGDSVKNISTYGTTRLNALHIIEHTLNMKSVTVTDEVLSTTTKSGTKRVINKKETVLAMEKQNAIIEEFQNWIWTDPKRKERLEAIFIDKFGSNIIRKFNGSFLTFPEMSPDVTLYDYQKNAVARILFSPNTLLAHDVGSGKTYIMAAAGMELRRMGISKKNLYVVPNNLVGQWKDIFLQMYPSANLLCIEPKTFKKEKRESILCQIRDEDFDGIIIAYSCFELIPLSKEFYISKLKAQLEEIYQTATKKNKATSQQNKKADSVRKALEELEASMNDVCDIYFDELGINTMFVDEAHNFKNVPVQTKTNYVLGISKTGSAKCQDMMDKVHTIQKSNNGRGIVMATGTPITNSITDIFIMQKYLQNGELSLLDLQSFDSWIGMFAESHTEFEIDVDTSNFRMATRFSKIHNLPELSSLLSGIADFHKVDESNGIPEFNGYTDSLVTKTGALNDYLKEISSRADDVRKGRISRTEDNMLKITTDGRKAALDLRLVDPAAVFTYQSKAAHCAENVADIYHRTRESRATQIIFCDTSTPKSGFNMYDELKNLLISLGVSEDKIAYIHSADTEAKRNLLFSSMRRGEISILIGSTFKLGLGVNVQDKLIAIHHLDIPWRPSDMVQREGRILRKGNQNKTVSIYRYITEGSFDAYSWQLLESKQKMISSILSGCATVRTCSDVDDSVLDYAEVKALAVGNPLIKKRVETANELSRYITLQRQMLETKQNFEKELLELPGKIQHQERMIENCIKDIQFYNRNKRIHSDDERAAIRTLIHDAIRENELSSSEYSVCTYQGFTVIIPTNMLREKPYIYLQKNGRYYIELGISKSGILIRIDNFLDGFEKHLEKLRKRANDLYSNEIDIKNELKNLEGYADLIENLENEIKRIDEELGVKR